MAVISRRPGQAKRKAIGLYATIHARRVGFSLQSLAECASTKIVSPLVKYRLPPRGRYASIAFVHASSPRRETMLDIQLRKTFVNLLKRISLYLVLFLVAFKRIVRNDYFFIFFVNMQKYTHANFYICSYIFRFIVFISPFKIAQWNLDT